MSKISNKMKWKYIFWLVMSIGIFILAFYNWSSTSSHVAETSRKTIVINKLPGYEVQKHRVTDKFYLILKDASTGHVFDLIVTPSTYSEAVIGQTMYFKISDEDVKHDPKIIGKRNLSEIMMIISIISALICLISWFVLNT